MDICTATSTTDDGLEAVEEAVHTLRSGLSGPPDICFLHTTEDYDVGAVNDRLSTLLDDVPIQGGTSCQAVMTESGVAGKDDHHGLALMGIEDRDGAYGVGAAELGDEPRSAAHRALQEALQQAGRPGEVPQLIWLTVAPGVEEELIDAIGEIVGPDVPVLGGSSADDTVAGNWHQFANGDVFDNAVVCTAIFSSGNVGYSFHSGYEPTEYSGTITKATGRTLFEIDGQPAAEVYNRWTDGLLDDALDGQHNVLADTSLFPLGRVVGTIEDTPYFQLSHPESVTSDNALELFTNIEEGEEIWCMTGTVDSLIDRAGRVAESALETSFSDTDEVAGSLVIYCAGCMLTVADRIDEVAESLNTSLHHTPYLGTFTFGEQGCFLGGENRHGNLMISVVTFYS